MPRNPNKRRCQTPGCRAWAMRPAGPDSAGQPDRALSSAYHCRSHLDHQLGPRNAGAPRGNFNAVKSGRYANPFSPDELKQLAYQLVNEPDSLPQHIAGVVQSIHGRSESAFKTLLLLNRFLIQLLPAAADAFFAAELDAFLQSVPPAKRPGIRSQVWKYALSLNPIQRPILITAIDKLEKESRGGKTIDGTKLAKA